MEINFNQVLYDIRGNTIKEVVEGGSEKEDLTLKSISVGALLQFDQSCDGKEKFNRYELAKRIQGVDEVGVLDLAVDEVAKVKKLVGKIYAPVVVGQAWAAFDKKKEPTQA